MHLLYVPTHRPALDSVAAYVRETAFLSRLTRAPVAFALVEAQDGPWVQAHAHLLYELGQELNLDTYHITAEWFEGWLRVLLEELELPQAQADYFMRLLHPPGLAYGAGPNKAALLGAALGARVLHRRDSDTLPSRSAADVERYPVALELRAITRRLDQIRLRRPNGDRDARGAPPGRSSLPPVQLQDQPEPSATPPEDVVHLVATTYSGDPPVDHRALLEAGIEFPLRIEALSAPGQSAVELAAELQESLVAEPARNYPEDFLELDETGRVEMGASCSADLWRAIPELPMVDTLGSDDVVKNLLNVLQHPVIFHARKVLHRYDAERAAAKPDNIASYALCKLRQILLSRVLLSGAEGAQSSGLALDSTLLRELFARARAAVDPAQLRDVIAEFARVHATAANRTTGRVRDGLVSAAQAVERAGGQLIDQVLSGIDDYTQLLDVWPGLIDVAARCGLTGEPA